MNENAIETAGAALVDGETAAWNASEIMLGMMADGLDHPELWALVPALVAENPLLPVMLRQRHAVEPDPALCLRLQILIGLCIAAPTPHEALDRLMAFSPTESLNVQLQGAIFHLQGLLDPENPKYRLAGKICLTPFTELGVLENSAHLCCAAYMPTPAGDLMTEPGQAVWNGATAQAIRASVTDGSYRYCNKRICPKIQGDQLPRIEAVKADPKWHDILDKGETVMPRGPEAVNLSYDRTCNLSCPSCRTERYAADDTTRARYEAMQDREILPLLGNARTVFVTGSGDPFASKNFRRLMGQLDAGAYPGLKFIVMTNGMLFTPRQWAAFPSLHGRVQSLSISLDGATGPTHELLRRGARWAVMEENLRFAGTLLADGLIDEFMVTFTVQAENFREMGDFVDLAHRIGANRVHFGRITNWGSFSAAEYAAKAVFIPGHPDYADFLAACRDPRLRDPIVAPSDLDEFIRAA